ncbi:MAG TPA: response regulator transcription factor [Nitriliruptorales bacterium]|nr:response regulator transcription factor [Nitriliruptorales bacterium]
MITVLLVEDHPGYREALAAVLSLEDDIAVVGQAERGDEAGRMAANSQPAVALVDLDLPGGDGITAVGQIHRSSPTTACVILTARPHDVACRAAIQAGAAALLRKSVEVPVLLSTLRAVAQGRETSPRAASDGGMTSR